jgi:hypothetical protein
MLSPTFPAVHLPHLEQVELPPVMRVRLRYPGAAPVADVEGTVRDAMGRSRRLADLRRGASVAVAVGSRGVAEIPVLARTVVAHLKGLGLEPFIVPAMGSHGGGTAEGQAGVLKKLGVTEASTSRPSAPIASPGRSAISCAQRPSYDLRPASGAGGAAPPPAPRLSSSRLTSWRCPP